MFSVTKYIDFCYGHRLRNYEGKCKYLHGHNGRIEIELAAEKLDGRGMVVDFGDIKNVMKKWVDENLDHRMLLRKDDPAIAFIAGQGEPYYLMDENPTAENIAKLIYEQTAAHGFPVARVILWETPDSFAAYGK
ncbi:6-carboxytetrahydropterin synthase QueD [Candidatus Sumerlaeota bacterium]|nr:6-carboxytetrahydropterin synthase QueD [Candidatus Sumerlaeota bacterium]